MELETDNPLATDEDYKNILVSKDFQSVDMSFIRFLNSPDFPLGQQDGDCVDALVVALDLLIKKTKGKKFTRKVYLFTDAAGPVNSDGFEAIVEQLKELEVQLIIM